MEEILLASSDASGDPGTVVLETANRDFFAGFASGLNFGFDFAANVDCLPGDPPAAGGAADLIAIVGGSISESGSDPAGGVARA